MANPLEADRLEDPLPSGVYDDPCDLPTDDDDPSTDWKTEIAKPTATLYSLLLIIANVALALSSQTRRDNHIPVSYSKWFDAVLYGLSIAYLFYAMMFLFPEEKAENGHKTRLIDRIFPCSLGSGIRFGKWWKVSDVTLNSATSRSTVSIANSDNMPKREKSVAANLNWSSDANVKLRTRGSVYLKLNAIICGVGAMIYSCLEFGVWLSNWHCYEIISGIIPLLLTVYISAQTYFIFLYSKRVIARHTILSRFGLMHLVATDVTIWLRVLIDQTLYEFSVYRSQEQKNNTLTNLSSSSGHHDSISLRSGSHVVNTDGRATSVGDLDLASVRSPLCSSQGSLLGDVLVDASVFLYPCIIGYAVISAGIVYVMCKNMGSLPATPTPAESDNVSDASRVLIRQHSAVSTQSCQHCQAGKTGTPMHMHRLYWLDCDQAVGGLLAGSVVLAMTIVCLILFFIFKTRNPEHAILEAQIGEAILYTLGIGAVSVAFFKTMKNLPKNRNSSVNWELDTAMLLTSMMGVYAFPILSIIGTNDEDPGTPTNSILIILTSSMSIIQSTMQTVYIFEASNRSIPETAQDVASGRKVPKPGRNALTFLIVVNLAFWNMNIFKTLRSEASPMQREFFGFYEWTIITHVTVPLQILYRFHSAASLFEIWKHAYKVSPMQCQCRELNEEAQRRSQQNVGVATHLSQEPSGAKIQPHPLMPGRLTHSAPLQRKLECEGFSQRSLHNFSHNSENEMANFDFRSRNPQLF